MIGNKLLETIASYRDLVTNSWKSFDSEISTAVHKCHPELCRNLKFTGNADIAGLGVRRTWLLMPSSDLTFC